MRYLDSIFPILENSSDSEIKKFKEEFEKWYENHFDKSPANKDNKKEFEKLGVMVCEVLGVEGFPLSGAGRCFDAPNNTRVCESDELWEVFDEYLPLEWSENLTDDDWDLAKDLAFKMSKLGQDSNYLCKEDAENCKPDEYVYTFFRRKEGVVRVTDENFYDNMV